MLLEEKNAYYTAEDYFNTPESVRLELINGKFYYKPTPNTNHQLVLGEISYKIGNYIHDYIEPQNRFCEILMGPFAVKLREDKDNIVEPDIMVILDKSKLTERACIGAPDLLIEIVLQDDPWHDYITKLNLYYDAGVREYWIVDPMKETIFVYYLEESNFNIEIYTFQDKIKVGIFENLAIDFKEIRERLL